MARVKASGRYRYNEYFMDDDEDANVTTTNTFTSVYSSGDVWTELQSIDQVTVQIRNTHAANGLSYQILASLDSSIAKAQWPVLKASTNLAGSTTAFETLDTNTWKYLDVQVKSQVADTASTVRTWIHGEST